MAEPVIGYVITPHAAFEMMRRRVGEEVIRGILTGPEQRFPVRSSRHVLQSRITFAGKSYLVRVFVDIDRDPTEVVTLYRTSKIGKYWRETS